MGERVTKAEESPWPAPKVVPMADVPAVPNRRVWVNQLSKETIAPLGGSGSMKTWNSHQVTHQQLQMLEQATAGKALGYGTYLAYKT